MKKIFLLSFYIIFFSTATLTAKLKVIPKEPQAGDTIRFEYTGYNRFADIQELYIQIYSFDETSLYPVGNESILKKNGDMWKGEFLVQSGTVYMMFKIFSAGEYIDLIDNNFGRYYEALVKSSDNYVRGANLRAALARLGSISSNIDRLPEFHSAIQFLETELQLYPDNIAAELGLITTLFDTKKINNDEFQKKLEAISKVNVDENNESAVRTKMRALFAVNDANAANALEQQFIQRYPNSELAEDALISEITAADNQIDFVRLCKLYFEKFPSSVSRERVFTAFITAYLQSGLVKELINELDKMNNVPGYAYSRIVRSLFEFYKSNDLLKIPANKELLITLAQKAVDMISYNSRNDLSAKPKLYTQGEWFDILDVQLGAAKEIQGEILKEVEPVNGVVHLREAIELMRTNATENLYENLLELLISLGDSAKALEISELSIVRAKQSSRILEYHEDACKTLLYLNDSLYSLRSDSLFVEKQKLNREMYSNEILNLDEFQYVLETMEGTLTDFRDLKGKVVVFNFFSSWCDPCIAMFPAFKELFDLYKENPEVEIVSVNTLEKNYSTENLRRFVVQHDLNFPVARDVMDIIPRQMGVNGLPTLAIFDRESKVRFLVKGFANNEQFLDDLSGRIEFLLNFTGD
ncbi:MAG: TlpA disulfide reductase family protein [Candidatus Kapaibacterium sp.]